MSISTLIFYLFRLIRDGHKWQYKNINGKGDKPKLYFSFLQYIAICISIYFIITKPSGLSSFTSDCILGCLSIMVALFISLLIVLYDKSGQIISKEQDSSKKLHSWNFIYQFNALTSYAVLLSIFVIVLVVITIMLDVQINIFDYYFIPPSQWTVVSIFLFFKCLGIILVRFCISYFLIDFFIISLYSVCSIYQFMYLEYKKEEPKLLVYNEKSINESFKEEYGFNVLYIKIPLIIILSLIFMFLIIQLIKVVP